MNWQRLCLILMCFLQLGAVLGCSSYRWGYQYRALPGNYKKVAIPMFKNKTQETDIEVYFTNALKQEFLRSQVAQVTHEPLSDVTIKAEIDDLSFKPSGEKTSKDLSNLPDGSVLATQYAIYLTVHVWLIKNSDGQVLWKGDVTGERAYLAPQVAMPGVNSVNPLYNLSSRRQNIDAMASSMMQEAFNRMTENF